MLRPWAAARACEEKDGKDANKDECVANVIADVTREHTVCASVPLTHSGWP